MPTQFVARRADGKDVWLHSEPDATKKARDARWGDFLNIQSSADGWAKVKWGAETYFIRSEDVASSRPLELIFLDVGQGDGCILVSSETGPKERIVVIDAGVDDNMFRFVKWRFGKLKNKFRFHAAVITHSDLDHYAGFQKLFDHESVEFGHVFHNGIVERADETNPLGQTDPSGRYITGIVQTQAQLDTLLSDPAVRGSKRYPKLLHTALTDGRVEKVAMLSSEHGAKEDGKTWLPGFRPSDGAAAVEVLGPVPETAPNGKKGLRWFGPTIGSNSHDDGKTKNGHSVLLRLSVGKLNVLFGGDLNKPAEDYLLRHYGAIPATQPLRNAVEPARARLAADILKSCHHGAADVTDEFLKAVNPFAYVVSSGDEEMYAHPRPDLLGRLGKNGRGSAPLIFCTEILRSTREQGRAEDFAKLRALDALIDSSATTEADRKAARIERKTLQDHIQRRNVGVYGAITMRTDGQHLQVTHRLEKPNKKRLWQTYPFEFTAGDWKPV